MNLIEKEFSLEALSEATFTNNVAYILPSDKSFKWSVKDYIEEHDITNNYRGRITTMYEQNKNKDTFVILFLLDLYHEVGILKSKVPRDHAVVLINGSATGYPEIIDPLNGTFVDEGHRYLVRMKKYLNLYGFTNTQVNPVSTNLTKVLWRQEFKTLAKREDEKESLQKLEAILNKLKISCFHEEIVSLYIVQGHKKLSKSSIYC